MSFFNKFGKTLKDILLPIAPALATATAGPLAGMAMSVLAKELGVEVLETDSPKSLEGKLIDKLEVITEDKLIKIKEAENQLKIRFRELDIDEEKLHQEDRASARGMRVSMKDRFPDVLACVIFAAFGITLYEVLEMAKGDLELNQQMMTIVTIWAGALTAAVTSVINFYFGSSKGSQRKTEIMNGGK